MALSPSAPNDDLHFLQVRRGPVYSPRNVLRESWVVQADRCRTAVERVLPDAGIEIYFNLGTAGRCVFTGEAQLPCRAAWIVGPHAASLLVAKETAQSDLVGIRLRPAMAERILGVSAQELRDSLVDLELVWGRSRVETIRDQLFCARQTQTRLDIVDQAIASRLLVRRTGREDQLVDAVVAEISTRDQRIGDTAARFRLSHRRLIQLVERHIGIKPKMLQRVQRLWRVLRCIHGRAPASWSAIAHACGYFDQAHLTNDFRELTGISPVVYASSRSSVGCGFAPHQLAGPNS